MHSLGRVRRRAGVILVGATAASCGRASEFERFEAQTDPLTIAGTIPESGANGPPGESVDVCWTTLIAPRSVGDDDVTISSGSVRIDAEVELQLIAWRPPGGRSSDAVSDDPWCAGSVLSVVPRTPLVSDVTYRVRVDDRIAGWDGQVPDVDAPGWLETAPGTFEFVLEFATSGSFEPREPPPPRTLEDLFAPGMLFDPARTTCSCHRDPDHDAASLLDLRDADHAFEGLVIPTRTRDTGFPMVTPYRPSHSFLMHKLVRTSDDEPLRGVFGDVMPPERGSIPHADLVALAQWIEAGAPR